MASQAFVRTNQAVSLEQDSDSLALPLPLAVVVLRLDIAWVVVHDSNAGLLALPFPVVEVRLRLALLRSLVHVLASSYPCMGYRNLDIVATAKRCHHTDSTADTQDDNTFLNQNTPNDMIRMGHNSKDNTTSSLLVSSERKIFPLVLQATEPNSVSLSSQLSVLHSGRSCLHLKPTA